jgi:hypothetical protein
MYEGKHQRMLSKRIFLKRITHNLFIGFVIIIFSLFIGMLGYHHLAKLSWISSFENAAMILSGMGPVDNLSNDGARIFAGCYAIFSGVIFLVVIAVIFAPVIHRAFHKFHLAEDDKGK